MMVRMERPELSPVSSKERFFTAPGFTALWASLAISVPAIALGAQMGSAEGMGLTYIQILLVIPIGLILGGAVMAAVGWMGADIGVPTGLLFRPSLGLVGSWVASGLQALLYVVWAAIEIQLAAMLLQSLAAASDVTINMVTAIGIVTGLVAVLVWMGMAWVSGTLIRRVTFWVALVLVLWVLGDLARTVDFGALQNRVPDQRLFWLGIDTVLALMILWAPLAGDSARFAPSTNAATTATGFGFGVGLGTMLMLGSLAGLGGLMDGTLDSSVSYFSAGAGTLALVVAASWLLVGELDQPFGFVYGAATGLSTTTRRRAPVWMLFVVVALVGALAALLSQGSMMGVATFLLAVFSPLMAILIADFFIVRKRRYLTDGLYQSGGPYGGLNWYGTATFVLAFSLQQWIRPTGPVGWIELVETIPGAGSWDAAGVPAVMIGMVVAFAMYAGLGRWKIAEWESVSVLRL